jgi:O-phosphoseryl-tRNA(Cys) synthetase
VPRHGEARHSLGKALGQGQFVQRVDSSGSPFYVPGSDSEVTAYDAHPFC